MYMEQGNEIGPHWAFIFLWVMGINEVLCLSHWQKLCLYKKNYLMLNLIWIVWYIGCCYSLTHTKHCMGYMDTSGGHVQEEWAKSEQSLFWSPWSWLAAPPVVSHILYVAQKLYLKVYFIYITIHNRLILNKKCLTPARPSLLCPNLSFSLSFSRVLNIQTYI